MSAALLLPDLIDADEAGALARAFRDAVAAEDRAYLRASWRMVQPIEQRARRYPGRDIRRDAVRAFEREWRLRMPQEFSLDYAAVWSRRGVVITENRIGCASVGDADAVISVGAVRVTLLGRVARVRFNSRAIVDMDALAARYRLGRDNSDAAIIRDLAPLIEADPSALPVDGCGTVAPGWQAEAVEAVMNERRKTIVMCRSWLPA